MMRKEVSKTGILTVFATHGGGVAKRLLLACLAIILGIFIVPCGYADELSEPSVKDSAYTLTEVSSSGADTISYRYFDSTNNTYVTKYYKITLNNSSFGDSLTWSESSTGSTGSVKITLPNGTEKTYYYTYSTPSGYTETSTRITSPNSSNVSNKVFKNITDSSTIIGAARGAIYNTSSTSINITSDFVQNGISDSWTTQGGAINNEGGSFNNITGDFIGNFVRCSGRYATAGAINIQNGSIQSITSKFYGNYTYAGSSSQHISMGGAIKMESATLGTLTGEFIQNYSMAESTSVNTYGGALSIYNQSSTLTTLSANFIGNYTYNTSTSNSKYAYGGAIYNAGTIKNEITNCSFLSNYAYKAGGTGTVLGGAIYTSNSLSIGADNGISIFSGNYTQLGSGTKDYNAIYVGSSSATLTLNVRNNGVIVFDDNISGVSGYNVKITGDSTGVINLYNDVKNANITTDSAVISTANNITHEYNFLSLNSNVSTKYSIDVDLTNNTSDIFVVGSSSTGTITLDDLNLIGGDWNDFVNKSRTIQIIKASNNNLQLAISDNLQTKLDKFSEVIEGKTGKDVVSSTVNSNEKLYNYENASIIKTIGVGTTTTTNDSLQVVSKITGMTQLDTLAELLQLETSDERNFNIVSDYTAISDLGTATAGTININGNNHSIDLNSNNGIQLANKTALNFNDVTVGGNTTLVSATTSDATVGLNNVTLNGNISGAGNNVAISGNTKLNGVFTNTNTTFSNGTLSFNENTFADSNNTLNVTGGNVNLSDGVTTNYVINSLTSSEDANYSIDVIFNGSTGVADTILASANSSGVITIDSINFTGNITQNMTINILDTTSDSLSIKLAEILNGEKVLYNNRIKSTFTVNTDGKNLIFTFISSEYLQDLNATISNISKFSKNILKSNNSVYTLTEVTSDTTVPENAVTVKIDGKTYYYLPDTSFGLTKEDYQNLANTGHVALKELTTSEGAIYQIGDKYYGYDSDKLPESAYTLTEVSSAGEDTISYKEYDSVSGTYVTKYYKITLKTSNLGQHLTWSEDSTGSTGSIVVTLPNGTAKTYYYTYTTPEGYTDATARVSSLTVDNVTNKVFKNLNYSSSGSGGAAIYNNADNSTLDITADFIGNYSKYSSSGGSMYGGAVYNSGKLNSISGTFVDNYVSTYGDGTATYGGAIYNSGTINTINADFIRNYSKNIITGYWPYIYGGAIYNQGTITNLTGKFVGNYAYDTVNTNNTSYMARGGALYNTKVITNVLSDFVNNYAYSTYYAHGGAIYNTGTITGLTGDFVGNYVESPSGKALGGAVYNTSANGIGLTNNKFIGNFAKGSSLAKGGAIYTSANLTLTADNGTTLFSGNYTQVGTGEKDYNAIYVGSSSATLTLNARNNGAIVFDDNISGVSGYNVKITGDPTGVINLYNDVKNANITTDSAVISTANNITHEYNFLRLNSNVSTKYSIDVDLTNNTSDIFVVGSSSTGTITLDDLNFIGGDWNDFVNKSRTIQIIKASNNNLQLAISDNLQTKLDKFSETITKNEKDIVSSTVNSNEKLYKYENASIIKTIGVGTTTTTNDSLQVVSKITGMTQLDTLAELLQLETSDGRNFNIVSDYTAISDLGTATAGTININGNNHSIDLNSNNGIQLANQTALNVNDVTVGGNTTLVSATTSDATIGLNNVTLNGNISGAGNNVSISGNTKLNGVFTNTNTTFSNGTLSFNESTFADSNNTLNVTGGNVNLSDGVTTNYVINSLTSSSDAKYSIDVRLNSTTGIADTISTTSDASGVITIDNIKFSGNITQDMTINILNTVSNNISIVLSDIYNGRNIFYYQGTKNVFDLSTDGKYLNFDFVSSEYSQFENGTISNIKQTSNSLLNNESNVYTLTEVTSDTVIPEGAVRVTVEGTEYYYIPTLVVGTTVKDYQNLANTGHVALKELATSEGAIYQIGDKYYGYDSDKLADSAYTLTEVESSGAGTITKYEKTTVTKYYDKQTGLEVAEGDRQEGVEYKEVQTVETTPVYFDVNLSKTEYGEGGNTKIVTVNILGKDIDITVKYDDSTKKTYTNIYTSAIHNTSTITIEDAIFKNITSSSALVYNNEGTITSLTGDFISNSVIVSSDVRGGGVIGNYAYSSSPSSSIGNITGDFISNTVSVTGNYVFGGGVIGNYAYSSSSPSSPSSSSTSIGNITGDFISNTVSVTGEDVFGGGVIGNSSCYYSSSSSIGNITGDFISNSVTVNDYLFGGGVIGNYACSSYSSSSTSSIGNITGDFISNSVTVNLSLYGGGVIGNSSCYYYSSSSIGNITGDFISNSVTVNNYLYGGGVIGNYAYSSYSPSSSSTSIGNITGDFISNSVTISVTVGRYLYGGGVIGNYAYSSSSPSSSSTSIGNITGDFISNTVSVTIYDVCGGGVIGNYAYSSSDPSSSSTTSSIGNITGDFISNSVTVSRYLYGGGVIGNCVDSYSSSSSSSIGNITGDFISNTVSVTIYDVCGGGVIGNYAYSSSYSPSSSSTSSSIGNITGDFISNSVTVSRYLYGGGVIGNCVDSSYHSSPSSSTSSSIGNITGDFISNTVSVTGNYVYGGGVIGNYVDSTPTTSTIGQINSKFYNNTLKLTSTSSQNVYGGGVIGNYGSTSTILGITGEFVNNAVIKETGSANVYSGVIYNSGKITNGITNSTFTGNYVKISEGSVYGGAIYTSANLTLTADNGTSVFRGNYTQVGTGEKDYNAIYVGSSSATLKLNAVNNGVIQLNDNINGASGYDVKITGDSTGVVKLYNDIKNADVITDNVTVDTANGQIHNYNFKTLTSNATTKYSIDIDLTNKTSDKFIVGGNSSGKITIDGLNILSGSFESITDKTFKVQILHSQNDKIQLDLSDYIKSQLPDTNYKIGTTTATINDDVQQDTKWSDIYKQYTQDTVAYGKLGLATTDTTNDSIGIAYDHSVTEDKVFVKNLDTLAHVNQATLDNKNFIFDSSDDVYKVTEDLGETAQGTLNINGVLSKTETTDPTTNEVTVTQNTSTIDFDNKSGFELNNSTVLNINNTTLTKAIGTNGAVISANNQGAEINLNNTSLVKNISSGNGGAIYSKANVNINADDAVVSISNNSDATSNVAIYMDNANKTLTLNSTNNGVIKLDDKINGATGYNVNITGDTTGNVLINNNIDNANLTLGATNISLSKDDLLDNSQSLTMNGTNLSFANNTVGEMHIPTFNLVGINNIKVDADLENKVMDRIIASNYNISDGAMLNVSGINIISPTTERKVSIPFADSQFANNVAYTGINPVAYSPIYKYKASYDVNEADGMGYFTFVRGASGDSNSYNPSVLAPSVAQQTGTYTTQLNTFNYAFQHADLFMNMPTDWRIAYKNRNKYATSNVGVFSPLMTGEEINGFWIKPYATFENIPLKNGPKVNSISYGTLVGYDDYMVSLKRGWDRVFTYYLGYNGASQNYSGVDCYQNGGLLGATMTLYKGNFFTATTLSAGATVGEAHTMYGTEYSTTMFAGIGNKTGYNIEVNQGKFIVQPSMLLAYTFLNTFDYKNAAGVQINSDPTSMIQIAPTVRFVVNTKTGWQPYLAVGMVWNILAHSNIKANNEELPDMYTKPYVQYGLGLQRVVKDRFTAFGQAMIYNGGRNGVSLTAGIRYALGKDGHKHTAGNAKVVKDSQPKVVKELPQKLANSDTVSTKMINSDTVQATTDKKVASKKEVKKVKSDKNDKKVTKEKRFDFKLQQPSISIMR